MLGKVKLVYNWLPLVWLGLALMITAPHSRPVLADGEVSREALRVRHHHGGSTRLSLGAAVVATSVVCVRKSEAKERVSVE